MLDARDSDVMPAGQPVLKEKVICIHEEDAGERCSMVLAEHSDLHALQALHALNASCRCMRFLSAAALTCLAKQNCNGCNKAC